VPTGLGQDPKATSIEGTTRIAAASRKSVADLIRKGDVPNQTPSSAEQPAPKVPAGTCRSVVRGA
jgi:hypothetical protein